MVIFIITKYEHLLNFNRSHIVRICEKGRENENIYDTLGSLSRHG